VVFCRFNKQIVHNQETTVTTSQSLDDPTNPSAPADLQHARPRESQTVKIEMQDLGIDVKAPAGNAILRQQTTVTLNLIDSEAVLTAQIAGGW
jgi:hypothetical protein